MQSVWVGKLLPLNILNAANLSFLITFAASNLLLMYAHTKLSPRYILRIVTLFALGILAIFGVSEWEL